MVGCTTISTQEFEALQNLRVSLSQVRKEYRIQQGDTLRVAVYRGVTVPKEYDQQITVQPDGRITLVNHATPIQAAGLTTAELQSVIHDIYSQIFAEDPTGASFEVTVQFLTSQKAEWLPDQVYVTGQVYEPAAIPYREGLTIIQAVTYAGGWRYTADESRVVVLRSNAEGATVSTEVNLEAIVEHEGNDLVLFPGDIVFVPLSTIAKINLAIEFYIRGLLPFSPSNIRTFTVWAGW
jgi:polysaccharide export outer membrane protein